MPNVLIAEDDVMIADMIEELLCSSGYTVCGIARTVAEGIALAKLHMPDLAIIDLRLADDGLGTEITAKLDHSWTGVLFATGNIEDVLTSTDGDACLSKPYLPRDLLRSLDIVRAVRTVGALPAVFPPRLLPLGFYLLQRAEAPDRELSGE